MCSGYGFHHLLVTDLGKALCQPVSIVALDSYDIMFLAQSPPSAKYPFSGPNHMVPMEAAMLLHNSVILFVSINSFSMTLTYEK